MRARLRAATLFLLHGAPRGLLLRQEPAAPAVKALVFGDSWGAMGPSWQMLRDMFERHGVSATVESTAVSGTTSWQWAKKPQNLAAAANKTFGASGGPDFVWFTLGGNDLLLPHYLACSSLADSYEEATECAVDAARKARYHNAELLTVLFEWYPNVQVVQCAYDLQCAGVFCRPFTRWPYCFMNTTCANLMSFEWGKELILPLKEVFPSGKYLPIDVGGAVQLAGNCSNVSLGHPDWSKGSPCDQMTGCEHPAPDGQASWIIGEAFWDLFFEERLPGTPRRLFEMPAFPEVPKWEHQHETDVQAVLCNLDWVPDLENGNDNPPPCDHAAPLYVPRLGRVWEFKGPEGWVVAAA